MFEDYLKAQLHESDRKKLKELGEAWLTYSFVHYEKHKDLGCRFCQRIEYMLKERDNFLRSVDILLKL